MQHFFIVLSNCLHVLCIWTHQNGIFYSWLLTGQLIMLSVFTHVFKHLVCPLHCPNNIFPLLIIRRHGRPSDDAHESHLSGRQSPRLQDGYEWRHAGRSPAACQPAGHEGAA